MAIKRRDAIDVMISGGLVPVFNHPDEDLAIQVIKACYDGGLRVFEWTNRDDSALMVFRKVKERSEVECPGMKIGAGTILDIETAKNYQTSGAEFLVSPVFDPELAAFSRDNQIVYVPGCGSVTEIHQAQKYGAELVKVFPGNVLGPGFVKSVLAPMPWSKLMPTGGVSADKENIEAWFKAGVQCVGMGSKLFDKQAIESGNWAGIKDQVSFVLQTIKDIRS